MLISMHFRIFLFLTPSKNENINMYKTIILSFVSCETWSHSKKIQSFFREKNTEGKIRPSEA